MLAVDAYIHALMQYDVLESTLKTPHVYSYVHAGIYLAFGV